MAQSRSSSSSRYARNRWGFPRWGKHYEPQWRGRPDTSWDDLDAFWRRPVDTDGTSFADEPGLEPTEISNQPPESADKHRMTTKHPVPGTANSCRPQDSRRSTPPNSTGSCPGVLSTWRQQHGRSSLRQRRQARHRLAVGLFGTGADTQLCHWPSPTRSHIIGDLSRLGTRSHCLLYPASGLVRLAAVLVLD